MNFVNAATLVQKAQESGYAVPALNTNGGTYDITRAALEACDETGAPLIMQAYEPNLQYRGVDYFVKMARQLCDDLDIS
ncbi:MAG: class II fructose-bisphosphate aldolase, partial [Candidatus Pacebacteria bacterium]|nr:class II fructose-bisphosphate aldolase [Candidatus Paceibacterota bacterium]